MIKIHKTSKKSYIINRILAEHGHTALRLPPYHPDLNPIEFICADVKEWVARSNTTFKINDEQLCHQRFDEIEHEKWEKNKKHYIEKDGFNFISHRR